MDIACRLGILTDVHANPFALGAVLKELSRHDVQAVVHCGDAVDFGPQPRETLELLFDHRVWCVAGNHDEALYGGLLDVRGPNGAGAPANGTASSLDDVLDVHARWTRWRVGSAWTRWVASWPRQLRWRIGSASVLAQHYGYEPSRLPSPCQGISISGSAGGQTPNALPAATDACDVEPLGQLTPVAEADDVASLNHVFRFVEGPPTTLVFFGHSHRPADVRGRQHYLSPGPCGLNLTSLGRAPYLVVTVNGATGEVRVERREAAYDPRLLRAGFGDLPGAEAVLATFHPRLAEAAD